MAGVRNKIVRVENVTPTGGAVHFNEDTLLHVGQKYGQLLEQKNADLDDDILLGESALEEGDVVLPLPEGWPKIPQLFVRRSWDFSTATSPSVNKAVSHLELLQHSMEEWAHQVESEVFSRASSRATRSQAASSATMAAAHTVAPSLRAPILLESEAPRSVVGAGSIVSRRQLRFMSPSVLTSAPSATSRTTHTSQGTSGKLSIEGIGMKGDKDAEEAATTVLEEEDEMVLEVPYLGAEEVIDEVVTLLARLENDRRQARQSLQKEKGRIDMLQGRIDDLANNRLAQFAEAVQKEHEACSMDINELNWHVSYRSRIESRIKNKVAIAEVLNSRLKEDIDFVKKHCPLVEEKLELEREAMERIKQAQHDTNDELSVTVDRCAKVETKSEEAYSKADVERIHLQQEVEAVRADLGNISQELAEEKMLFNSYIHQCNDFRQQLGDNEQELMVLQVKHENAKTAEEMQHAKIRDLQGKIVEQEFEHRKHEDLNNRLQSTLDNQRRANATAEADRKMDIKNKDSHLRKLTLSNGELEMDIEDAISNIEKCDKQRIADDKNLVRMEKEQLRTHEQMKVTEDDLAKVRAINSAIREKLEKEEERCADEEESLKATCEQLRKQVKEEIHSRTVIMARINAENNDLAKCQADAKQKKEKMTKKADEVEAQINVVLSKVQRLRSAHDERVRMVNSLTQELEEVHANQARLETDHTEKRNQVDPEHKRVTEELEGLKKHLAHMDWKTEMMKKNMEDMSSSFKMMSRSMATTQKAIDKLQDEYDDLHIEHTSNQHLDEQMKTTLKQMTNRLQESGMRHKNMLKEREAAAKQHELDLTENLKQNKSMASRYRQLQNEYLKVKNELLNRYEERLKLENAIKDLKQIQSLQKRMHTAQCEYFKLRSQYNAGELARMEMESSQNGVRVGDLKTEMDTALDSISYFLRTQMDGSTARRTALEKVVLEETGQRLEALGIVAESAVQTPIKAPGPSVTGSSRASTAAASDATHVPEVVAPLIQVSRPPTAAIQVQ